MPMFLVWFLVVRGAPVTLYRTELNRTERWPFVLHVSTALPLVRAITQRGVETGHMSTNTATALVGAGLLSVLICLPIATTLRWEISSPDRLSSTPVKGG
jgi:hypothetical protein